MSDDVMPVDEAVRSLEAMGDRLRKVMAERDRYRDWFEKLMADLQVVVDNSGARLENRELAALTAKYQNITGARTRAKVRQGEQTRERVLDLQGEGKSITKTAEILGISPSRVAHIRGAAKRPK